MHWIILRIWPIQSCGMIRQSLCNLCQILVRFIFCEELYLTYLWIWILLIQRWKMICSASCVKSSWDSLFCNELFVKYVFALSSLWLIFDFESDWFRAGEWFAVSNPHEFVLLVSTLFYLYLDSNLTHSALENHLQVALQHDMCQILVIFVCLNWIVCYLSLNLNLSHSKSENNPQLALQHCLHVFVTPPDRKSVV